MNSDPSKSDLSVEGGILECPLTIWDFDNLDIDSIPSSSEAEQSCPKLITPPSSIMSVAEERDWFASNREMLREELLENGSLWLRGFALPKSIAGHRELYESLGMTPCLDPLHSSGLRKFASERDAVYEEVNKESLRGHYIGLHMESTTKRTAAYAAFVCFQKASEDVEPRGRFLIADGQEILRRLDKTLLKKLYERQVRISVSNLDLPWYTHSVLKR
tara:strand:- start:1300 stop:1953 length:654 start_codon:yes stop_codon:yes gene_type:complete